MRKKTLAFAMLILLRDFDTHGQSTFELSNRHLAAGIDAPVFDSQGIRLAGPQFLAELYAGRTPDKLEPAAASEEDPSVRAMVRFSIQGYVTSRFVAVFAVPAVHTAWLQLRAWDARLGATYEDAVARGVGGFGESPIFYEQGGGKRAERPCLQDLCTVFVPLVCVRW